MLNITNTQACKFYDMMIEGYVNGKFDRPYDDPANYKFSFAVIHLAETLEMNPFDNEPEACQHYFTMQMCYIRWKRNGVDSRINKRRMLDAAFKLCECGLDNPFTPEPEYDEEYGLEPVIDVSKSETLSLDALAEQEYAAENTTHVFGVVDNH